MRPDQLIKKYRLQPHPEGGFYQQSYQSPAYIKQACLPGSFQGDRRISTAIYFLLQEGDYSAFHRIKSDEIWHFYAGDTLQIHIISENGDYQLRLLGGQPEKGEDFQVMVAAGSWFAAECAPGTDFSFVGCTVAPGFDFADFELGEREQLCRIFPSVQELIRRLTRVGYDPGS
ncbi:MAG: hypothetical protein GC171_00015 [Terrimonas sp.]|nr:hypothetical protein [Terrimonas sp.]